MSLTHLLNRRFNVYRRTAQVLDSVTLSAATAADRTPTQAYSVEVVATYSSGALGTVEVAGTSNGSPASQTLDFASLASAAGELRLTTTLRFDADTAVTLTPSGWGTDPTVVARGVNRDGSAMKHLYLLQSSWPGRIDRKHGSWGLPREGSVQVETPYVFLHRSASYVPREGDELVDTRSSRRWRIESVPELDDFSEQHHWECPVRPQET